MANAGKPCPPHSLVRVVLLMHLVAACLQACGGADQRGPARTLKVSDFADGRGGRSTPLRPNDPAPMQVNPDAAPGAPAVVPPSTADASPPATRAQPPAATRRLQPGEPIIVDSVIGQVSGRPIFAHSLLEPIADRLRQEGRQTTAGEFLARATQIVNQRLRELVLNELFLAEAEASLTPQQQQGLLALLRDVQERTVAEGAGSRALRERQLREESGLTIAEYLEIRRSEMLISNLIAEKIRPRVIVSWKDVQREYARRFSEFNPPARVTLKRIRLFGDQREQIEMVRQRLAAGDDFDVVAAEAMPGEDATWDTFQMGPGGVSDIPIAEAYKPHLANLSTGQTTAAIDLEGRVVWLHVAAIEQPPGRSLFEVQRSVQDHLFRRRFAEERERYIQTVMEKGIYDELDQMLQRVMVVAMMRFSPSS